jgi:hypothetical protein
LVIIKPTETEPRRLTERNSKERIALLAHANTHGKKFFVTGGSHVCCDDFFKAQALIAREEELEVKQKLKKTLQAKSALQTKAMALLVEKAACFELNQYKNVSTKDLDLLLQWYRVPKEKMKKADKVAKWREIRTSNTPPPVLVEWTEEDEAELKRIADMEIDMADTYLGWYAAMQKKNAVAAVLDFTNEEWESLKQLKEDDMMRGMTNPSEEGNDNKNGGGLGAENGANVGEINEEAV